MTEPKRYDIIYRVMEDPKVYSYEFGRTASDLKYHVDFTELAQEIAYDYYNQHGGGDIGAVYWPITLVLATAEKFIGIFTVTEILERSFDACPESIIFNRL